MRKIVTGTTLFLLLTFITQWAVIRYFPALVYKIAVHRTDHKFNQWVSAGNTDAGMRRVVMPNPDFVYSALFYDITDKAVTVTGVLPDSTYASVSFYDDRCQPYYVYNNLDSARTGKFEFTIVNNDVKAVHQLHAKTQKGVIICRFLKFTDSSYRQLVPYQNSLKCEVK